MQPSSFSSHTTSNFREVRDLTTAPSAKLAVIREYDVRHTVTVPATATRLPSGSPSVSLRPEHTTAFFTNSSRTLSRPVPSLASVSSPNRNSRGNQDDYAAAILETSSHVNRGDNRDVTRGLNGDVTRGLSDHGDVTRGLNSDVTRGLHGDVTRRLSDDVIALTSPELEFELIPPPPPPSYSSLGFDDVSVTTCTTREDDPPPACSDLFLVSYPPHVATPSNTNNITISDQL
jgi:hypothetical protein